MDRPLSDLRPVGPFATPGSDSDSDMSEFDQIEVQRNNRSEDHAYTVAGVYNPGGSAETVGMVLEVDAIQVEGIASFALESAGDRAIFTAEEVSSIGVFDGSPELAVIDIS